jgi:putative membrane-bound dehydrogenase-like protein
MHRSLIVAAIIAALSLVLPHSALADDATQIKILYLGDRGHHQPAIRARQLIPLMYDRGIDITYTEKLADINKETLANYDALLIYANTERITPETEQALLDYVAGGRGLVVLHCGSYCFLNSPKYIALVGGQFKSHGTGEFDTETIDSDHPITKDLPPFRTWDETYVHDKHNERDRTVLQTRREGNRDEPWTWVRREGRGRVFYTAYGHDARTWNNPGFHALVERGIRWAAAKGDVFDTRPKSPADAKPFQYAEAMLPNYIPSARWGTQGEPIRTMQLPLDPAESMKHMIVPRDFEPRLFAAEPDITKPIAMAWDHRGRLWIAETFDYPNELQPEGQGRDRIKICEDTDHDGRADRFTIFAEKLSIPTSFVFARGGVIVSQAPQMLFLKDTDGDGRADTRETLFSGWGTQDTHAGPSNLRYGFDNWIYGIVGYSGFRGTVGGERHEFRQGFFRFKPDGSKLEFIRSTNNNSWGVGFSEEGLLFGSTANGCPSVFMPIANRYYERVRGWSPRVLENAAINNKMYPATEKVRQVDWHGGFTAGAGHALYTARTYPQHYWNRTAFVTEPTGHLVATFLLEEQGSGFTTYNSWNLLASRDEWTSPIAAEVGPDGNVWMIDWYNYIVQHNPTPQGFRTGRGAAYETDLRDKKHGRIYRLVYKNAKPADQPKLDPNDAASLIAGLKSDNMLWRMHAQRLIVERGKADIAPELIKLIEDKSVDSLGLNPPAIHAISALAALGADETDQTQLRGATTSALSHPSAAVRRIAAQNAPRDEAGASAILKANLLADRDPHVRVAALLALSESPASDDIARAIVSAAERPANLADRWLPDALTAAAANNDSRFLVALSRSKSTERPDPKLAQIAARVAEHYARRGGDEQLDGVLVALTESRPALTEPILAGLARGWPRNTPGKLTTDGEKALARLLSTLPDASKGQVVQLAASLGTKALDQYSAEITADLLATAKSDSAGADARASAARQLIALKKRDGEVAAELLALLSPRSPRELADGFIDAVSQSEAPETADALLTALDNATPGLRPIILRTLLSKTDWARSLLSAAESGRLRLTELSLTEQQALLAHNDKALAERAKKLLAAGGGLPDPDRQKVIEELGALVLKTADATKGKEIFTQHCGKCHRHGDLGTQIGPDLTGMAVHPKEELLVAMLDPSRSVEGNFVQYSVTLDDGRSLVGLLASETRTSLELIDAEAKRHTIARENVEELIVSKKSIMPDGFEKQVSADDLANLLEFLTQRGKYLPLDLRKVATTLSTQGMFYSKDAAAERLIFRDWTTKTVDGVPFVLVDPQNDRVKNVVLLYSPNGAIPPTMPKSVSLPCNTPAARIHLLSGVSGWGFNGGDASKTVSMIVRLHYADGMTEDHPLKDGVHFADYIRSVDVPESKLAFRLRGQQIRYLTVKPKRGDAIETIELVKGEDRTAPIVMAITVERPD